VYLEGVMEFWNVQYWLDKFRDEEEEAIRRQRRAELERCWQYPLSGGADDIYPDPAAVDDEDLW
jgi:hypothetical protein